MQGNDLDSRVVPRDVVVWEGLLGLFPDERERLKFERFRSKRKWAKALDCFTLNPILTSQIWHLTWFYNVEIDVVTYVSEDFAVLLLQRLDDEELPVRRVSYTEPYLLARSLAYRPSIRTVYDPYPEHQFMFGAKGRHLPPENAARFGVM